MAEVTKTWTFDDSLENWSLSDTGDVTMSRITDDGDPDNGCLQGLTLGRNNDGTGQAQWSGDYVDLGVPADAEVNGVSLKLRRRVAYWDTVNHGHWTVGSTLGTLVNQQNESGVAAWAEITGNTISGLTLAPSTALTITLSCDLDTANGKNAGITFRWDTIEVTVDYTPAFAVPEFITKDATGIIDVEATLEGEVTSLGDVNTVDVFFEWKEIGAGSWNTTTKQTMTQAGDFDQKITGLTADTDYEFRAVLEYENNGTQVLFGSTLSFKTEQTFYTLSITKVGDGSVELNGAPITLPYEQGHVENSEINLEAFPSQPGWVFTEWDIGGETDSANPTTVVMSGNVTVVVYFTELSKYTLSITKEGSGSVELNGDPITLPYEEELYEGNYEIEAFPDPFNSFVEWNIGGEEDSANPTTIVLSSNLSVIASFIAQSSYIIERGLGESPSEWEVIEELPLSEAEYLDTSMFEIGQAYSYRIKKVEDGIIVTPPTLTAEINLLDAPASILLKWGE